MRVFETKCSPPFQAVINDAERFSKLLGSLEEGSRSKEFIGRGWMIAQKEIERASRQGEQQERPSGVRSQHLHKLHKGLFQ